MLYINGRFLAQRITGVQRVGIELVKELDKIASSGQIEVVAPPGIINDLGLKNIEIVTIGKKSDNFWVQWTFPEYVKKHNGYGITFTGLCPIISPGYFVPHDVTFKRHPESYSRKFALMYDIVFRLVLGRCKHIFTVSNFSRKEISELYGVDMQNITVIYNSSNQLLEQKNESRCHDIWGLQGKNYILSVSSKNLHKNQKYILDCAKKYPEQLFVIAGGNVPESFHDVHFEKLPNVVLTGYVNDDELKYLYRNAWGFIFPSIYEGFGIPPLEAIVMGVKHIAVSDIPIFREIYMEGVSYFDPHDIGTFDLSDMGRHEMTDEVRDAYIKKYNWHDGAERIYRITVRED